MKKKVGSLIAVLLCLALTFSVKLQAQAANTTVTGTVSKETTSDLLYLSTSGGTMQIKLDSATDLSSCKVILPGTALTVEVYYGSDAYMHAASVKGGTVGPQATIDTSNTTTVQGTIAEGTSSSIIYLSTSGGTMQIKLDSTTDMSACKVIMLGKNVQISVARGSDAYMHALTITDVSSSVSYSGSASSGSYSNLPSAAGTLGSDSNENALYLGSTKYIVDRDTDFSQCKAYIKGRMVTVAYYKGMDGALHAAKVVDGTTSSNATVGSTVIATVTGKITSDSKDNLLYVATDNSGTMQIKLDSSTNTDNCGVLYAGKTIKVSVAHGSDEYLHALTITDR